MLNGVGFLIILACVFGSFLWSGGKMDIVLHALPHELTAIGGASLGAFLVSNSLGTVKKAGKGVIHAFKGARWKGDDYRDLLTLLFALLTTFRTGGATAIEPHLDDPAESSLFGKYPRLLGDHHLIEFVADYLRMMTVDFTDPHQMAEAMDADIERHHHEALAPQHALQIMADGLPAIGIVAAVLGVIKTMGSIDQPAEILGGMIGGALVGTFLGVLLAYCFVGPLALEAARDRRAGSAALSHRQDRDHRLRPGAAHPGGDRDRPADDPGRQRADFPATRNRIGRGQE